MSRLVLGSFQVVCFCAVSTKAVLRSERFLLEHGQS